MEDNKILEVKEEEIVSEVPEDPNPSMEEIDVKPILRDDQMQLKAFSITRGKLT